MSFSKQVKEELNSIQIKGNCCKKAYLIGALFSADIDNDTIRVKISDTESAEKLILLLRTIYKCEHDVKNVRRGCFQNTEISFKSRKISELIELVDMRGESLDPNTLLTCKGCRAAFLRGVFCSSGSVSDPQKTYSLEMRVKGTNRAEFVRHIIEEAEINQPSLTQRDGSVGLFYRNESSIEDFITLCGGSHSLFAFFEASLEKDLRNAENRATNCVARNISKSVEATALQISAIESLKSVKAFDDLPRELKMTAQLRIDNPDMSLGELADIHVPHISKSGLNHRLTKIIEEAKRLNLI